MIIGLDVGGTHTDVVLLAASGLLREIKVPTDPINLFNSVLAGLNQICVDVDITHIERLVLSTTLTTNAIIQNKIPLVGMLVCAGPGIDPQQFRTNHHYYPIAGCIDHRGREIESIDPDEIIRITDQLKTEGIKNIGVVGKFSTRNPRHETGIHSLLKDSFENIFLGHRVSGNLNFPRRIATTFLNAAVYPIHKKFFEAVQKSLAEKGLHIPIHILKADGGTMRFESSIDCPDQTILSGPAASVMGAVGFATSADTLVMDIGGTSTDMSVLIKQVPLFNPLGIRVGRYRTLIRSLQTLSIGLGGDSAVTIADNMIQIGPERLGPAMAYGGPVPTPTDALVVLDIIKTGDRFRAEQGIRSMAQHLNSSPQDLAQRIFDQTCKQILAQAQSMIDRLNRKPVYTVHELQEGYRINPRKLLVLGGPAQYFAQRLEALSDFRVTVVPKWKVANAIGAALARTTSEVVLFADTQQRIASAPEENLFEAVSGAYSKDDAIQRAFDLLKTKAIHQGADPEDLEMEVVEDLQFNMVRGFNTIGKNIRVKVQVKPGLLHGYKAIVANL